MNLELDVEAGVELRGESLPSRVEEEKGESGLLVGRLPMPWSRELNLRLTVEFIVSSSLSIVS